MLKMFSGPPIDTGGSATFIHPVLPQIQMEKTSEQQREW
jgi:hypothetical protein